MLNNTERTQQQQYHQQSGQMASTAKKPFVAKGHDALLKGAQDAKQVIELGLISGDTFSGTMINRDKYTITIDITTNIGHTERRTFYKHAIESFSVVKELN